MKMQKLCDEIEEAQNQQHKKMQSLSLHINACRQITMQFND